MVHGREGEEMTKLNSPLKREIHVHGVEAPVTVELSETGIRFQVRGTKKWVSTGWVQVVNACHTGEDLPSYLMGKPFEYLKHLGDKVSAKAAKRAEND
jgi:hypothetical protein